MFENSGNCCKEMEIASHGSTTYRRLGWRFEQLGMSVQHVDLNQTELKESLLSVHLSAIRKVLVLDFPSDPVLVSESFDFLFLCLNSGKFERIVALVAELEENSRPMWSELGVGLVLDRVEAPPEIVRQIRHWLES